MTMSISEKIRLIARRKKVTLTALADMTGQTNQNLSGKLTRNNFTVRQIMEIGEVLGYEVEISFIDKSSGEKI